MDTIFALASARGKAGVAVVRISGPQAFQAATTLAGKLPAPRKAGLRRLSTLDGIFLDEALVLIFEDNASFTGEQIVELQLHGSTAVVRAVLAELGKIENLRMAEPGEFTRRALENERMDLAQVEGLADLLDAETEAQRKQALKVLSGALGEIAEGWRRDLIRAAALLEATIDFADEDVPVDVSPEVGALMNGVITSLTKEVEGTRIAERIRDGFEIAIVGPPNAGKSTLLNALAGRDAAITSEFAGTTRDVIEVRMDLAGLPVTLLDTAGIREAADYVESVGIDRALDRANAADLRIFLLENSDDQPPFPPSVDDIVAIGKADLSSGGGFRLSGKTGLGVDQLIEKITSILEDRVQSVGIATRERHRQEMTRALDALDQALIEVQFGEDRAELAAEELRTAIRALDSLVGRVDVEMILDEIFSSFCLGK
ncbi:tRNA uridine-5-carboxymethylaminomethyl(34) synthesis GTPase MnmE [Aliiroseovarius lamellibrachiae]|uniref:tRNA uridine-5-carboxymethylaminomethyl(34) synthesis GTPase MnmE n=1 Tax=Aliiroseovarius lamellibrachiae TaxID=1924933 RepID=UPI001BE0FDF6|nr:tRNA uridine-5-carboxymethylaminomethyl(34) synthesis GTPase MnmE [Aliiroseovarius lamellibrachiae]MBT2131806.1 tRNA uridine-5-carboxymethylaminomethyl(34) synthesis GTPase MnmE [Aliiroseovarius lamellibrachiae]